MNDITPRFLLIDVDEPVANVVDTGGVPGPEMRLDLNCGPGMSGPYRIVNFSVEVIYSTFNGSVPTVRLYVKRDEN